MIAIYDFEGGISGEFTFYFCSVNKAVSYTHLDVYKRQTYGGSEATCDWWIVPPGLANEVASRTHLVAGCIYQVWQ